MGKDPMEPISSDVTVFLVDDDRGMVSSISQWLSLSGLKVRAFADPVALMKVVKQGVRCVVVSDIRMPGIDGMELLKLIKGRDRRIPVILITGHGDIPLAVEAMKIGAHEFLSKPFSPEKLLSVVEDAQATWIFEDTTDEVVPVSVSMEPKTEIVPEPANSEETGNLTEQIEAYERTLITNSLRQHNGSVSKVIAELDVPRRTLNAKMKKYGIERSSFR